MQNVSAAKHIVCIDDDDAMLRAVARTLTLAGYRVTATTSPKEALSLIVREGVDAIVSDLHMPDLSGDVVLAMIAQTAPHTMRVLLTSDTDFTRVSALSVPYAAHAFVAKSDLSGRLVPILRTLLADRAAMDQAALDDEARALARSIVTVVAVREYETLDHCERLAAWSRRLAVELKLSPTRQVDVELGALLHDIGQLCVRDAVFLKPGKLDEQEWREIRSHPDLGASLLAELPPLRRAIPIVQCHHERCDGQGYPRRLSRTAIPIDARIFQIADAYESIVRGGPYRKPRNDQYAREEIAANVGAQFDPEVHEAFFRIPPEEWIGLATLSP